jgi:uncharacterized protein YceK
MIGSLLDLPNPFLDTLLFPGSWWTEFINWWNPF